MSGGCLRRYLVWDGLPAERGHAHALSPETWLLHTRDWQALLWEYGPPCASDHPEMRDRLFGIAVESFDNGDVGDDEGSHGWNWLAAVDAEACATLRHELAEAAAVTAAVNAAGWHA